MLQTQNCGCVIPRISEIRISQGNRSWQLKTDDCFLGKLAPVESLISIYPGDDNKGVFVFTVTPNKNIRPRNKGAMVYQKIVPIGYGSNGYLGTNYVKNNLRVLTLEDTGSAGIWEIAVVAQRGNFFATAQKVYQIQLYLDGKENVVVPQLGRWP